MHLAGLPVADRDVETLSTLIDEPTRGVLTNALTIGTAIVALTIEDRERILRALDDPRTDALTELHGVLLREHEWRVRTALV